LTNNKIRGAQVDVTSLVGLDVSGNPKLALDRVETVFLAGQVSDTTRSTLDRETSDPQILGATLDDPVKQVKPQAANRARARLAGISKEIVYHRVRENTARRKQKNADTRVVGESLGVAFKRFPAAQKLQISLPSTP